MSQKKYNAAEQAAEKDLNTPSMENEVLETQEGQQSATEEQEMDELDKLKSELEKEKKEYLFLMAEFDNFRKRTIKEKSELIKSASAQVMKGLLPIVDDFERGLDATKNSEDVTSVRQGMELIYNKLVKFMESNGVKPMETNGKSFDADLHEAVAQIPVAEEDQKGKIQDTVEKGYTLNDKVLRHAKVVVAQ